MNQTSSNRCALKHSILRRTVRGGASVLGATAVTLAAIAVPAHASASTAAGATVSTLSTNRTVSYVGHGDVRPNYQGLDLDGDHSSDVWTYCVEPAQQQNDAVTRGSQTLTAHSLSTYATKDAARLRWVLQHGFGGQSESALASSIGVDIRGVDQTRVAQAMQAATQSAIWEYSSGYQVSPGFRYDTRTVGEAQVVSSVFTRTYAWLTSHAVPVAGTTTVWDSTSGQAPTQGLAQIPTSGGSTTRS